MTEIMCKKYNLMLDTIPYKPLPGKLGDKILSQISNKAWQDWISHQTILINEYRLSANKLHQ